MTFTVYRRLTLAGRRWFWRLRADNNEIIASGEGYVNRRDCLHAVELVQASYAAFVEVKE
jgi:uncharacterized protein YegP (UPF0339 family)